jgi:hypothetical protein
MDFNILQEILAYRLFTMMQEARYYPNQNAGLQKSAEPSVNER